MAEQAMRAVTGNRLRDGVPVYFTAAGGWSRAIGDAVLVEEKAGEALLARALDHKPPHPTVAPYLIEAIASAAGVEPVTLRERIRASGPTIV